MRPTNSTPVPAIVRYAPLAIKMVRRGERSDVPKGDIAVPYSINPRERI